MMNVQNADVINEKELLDDAARVFSRGYVDYLKSEGLGFIERGGAGSCLMDSSGREYIDCFTSAGTFNLGRGSSELMDALKLGARETDQGNFIAISEEKARLAERLAEFMPGNLECSLFTVVRGEAMDGACKLARGYTGRSEIITVDGGWYGHTGFSLTMSKDATKKLFGPGIPDIKEIPFGDIEAARKKVTKKTAAVVLEVIQAENGCRNAEKEYYRSLQEHCRKTGAVLIVDESQTGFGRTGERFAFESFGIEPDIAVLGEAIAGGMFPMTAFVFTRKLKKFFDDHPLIHLCTFGGHDVGCRVAMKAIDLYEQKQPWANARRMGSLLLKGLVEVMRQYSEKITSVQGKGLLLSLELDSDERARIFNSELINDGVFCVRGRVNKNSILIRPSLLVSECDVKKIIDIFTKIIERC